MSKHTMTFICKPIEKEKGKNIFITRDLNDIKLTDRIVVQKFVSKPHCIDGFKYDLRIFVCVCGVNPLRIYVYKDGLASLATDKLEKMSVTSLKNLDMQLVNWDPEDEDLEETRRTLNQVLDLI